MKRFKHDEAFTGLEAAIVLIAFVVVAAVFSYVVLGAGFFTTQKSQESVHSAVGQASSNIEVVGNVLATGAAGNELNSVTMYLQLAAGGTPVDMSKVTYTVRTSDQLITIPATGVTITYPKEEASNTLLEKFEMAKVMIPVSTADIGVNDRFIIEVKPEKGAALPIERTAPPAIVEDKVYEIY
ncbi:MAG: flagellin [Methanomicrobiales archaeon]|nr:flagellin [Methanomicrobiales archaeon]